MHRCEFALCRGVGADRGAERFELLDVEDDLAEEAVLVVHRRGIEHCDDQLRAAGKRTARHRQLLWLRVAEGTTRRDRRRTAHKF
eukprot:1399612-Rhodomonas_salina.4